MSLPNYKAEVITASGMRSSFDGNSNSEVLNKALALLGEEEGRILVLKKEPAETFNAILAGMLGAVSYVVETDIKKKSHKTRAKEAVVKSMSNLLDAVEGGKLEQASDLYQQLGESLYTLQAID